MLAMYLLKALSLWGKIIHQSNWLNIDKKKKNLIIFGGTGFIGYHLAKKILQKGWNITCVSSKSPKKSRRLSKVKYLRCDVRDNKKIKKNYKKSTLTWLIYLGMLITQIKQNLSKPLYWM